MRKIAWCGIVAAALVATSTGAWADVPVAKGAGPTKFAAVQPDPAGGGAATQTADGTTPPPARPRPKPRSKFFGLPLVGMLAGIGGGIAVAASSDDDNNPVSP
jgi:hypothetical protein